MADDAMNKTRNHDSTGALRLLERARGRTLAVLGDLMLDEWIIGTASRISPEAPVPIVRFARRETSPGGAANVAMNGLSLGANAKLCGIVGVDAAGDDLQSELETAGVQTLLKHDAARPTILKTRIVAQRQQMVRIDREDDAPFSPAIAQELRAILPALIQNAGVLCISDYAKGLASCGAIGHARELGRAQGVILAGGPKPANLACFMGFDFLSLNDKEAGEVSGLLLRDDASVVRAGEMLRAQTQARALVITRGGRGATLFQDGQNPRHLSAHEVEVFDVAGAGDTFLAGACVALLSGGDFVEACQLGNLAAAASVRHAGVVAVSPQEVRAMAGED